MKINLTTHQHFFMLFLILSFNVIHTAFTFTHAFFSKGSAQADTSFYRAESTFYPTYSQPYSPGWGDGSSQTTSAPLFQTSPTAFVTPSLSDGTVNVEAQPTIASGRSTADVIKIGLVWGALGAGMVVMPIPTLLLVGASYLDDRAADLKREEKQKELEEKQAHVQSQAKIQTKSLSAPSVEVSKKAENPESLSAPSIQHQQSDVCIESSAKKTHINVLPSSGVELSSAVESVESLPRSNMHVHDKDVSKESLPVLSGERGAKVEHAESVVPPYRSLHEANVQAEHLPASCVDASVQVEYLASEPTTLHSDVQAEFLPISDVESSVPVEQDKSLPTPIINIHNHNGVPTESVPEPCVKPHKRFDVNYFRQECLKQLQKHKYAHLQDQAFPEDSFNNPIISPFNRDIEIYCIPSRMRTAHAQHSDDLIAASMITVILGGGAVTGGSIITGPAIPVIVGGGLAVAWLVRVIKDKRAEVKEKSDGGSDGSDPEDPDKEKEKDKNKGKKDGNANPNGVYENNPKHHQNSKGDIGKPPRDGQKALNESIKVPGEKYRVCIQDKKFVMFKEHSSGRWHGYIVEKFTDLPREARNALWNARLVKNPTNGKIK